MVEQIRGTDWIALSDKEKKVLLVEVKWSDIGLRDSKRVLKDLERKSELIGLKDYEHNTRSSPEFAKGKWGFRVAAKIVVYTKSCSFIVAQNKKLT